MPGELRVNRHDFEPVFDAPLIRRRRRKGDANKRRLHEPPRVVVEPGVARVAGDTQGAHVRQVQQAGQAHLLLARLHQAEQRGVIGLLIEREHKRRGFDAGHVIGRRVSTFSLHVTRQTGLPWSW